MSSNALSTAQIELLAVLSEELGEVQQVIGKILRFGYLSSNPLVPPWDEAARPNNQLLEKELGDVFAAVQLLIEAGEISHDEIDRCCIAKLEKLQKWLRAQGDSSVG